MNTRLKQFLAAENISQAQFADTINVVRASVSHVLSGRNNPGYDFIKAIMAAYPTLNMEWLILGKGRMYKDQGNDLFCDYDYDEPPVLQSPPASVPPPSEQLKEPEISIQVPEKQRKASKVVIFFDDGTFQEMGF